MTKVHSFRRLIIVLCVMAMSVLGLSLMYPKDKSNMQVEAADQNLVVNAELLDTTVRELGGEYVIGDVVNRVSINNGDTVKVNNTLVYNYFIENNKLPEDEADAIQTQIVRFSMGKSDSAVQFNHLSISATLNGQELAIDLPDVDNSFEQLIFGLPNELKTKDGSTPIENTNGQFVFNYTYRVYSSSTGTEIEQKGSFSFNFLTAPYLSQTNESNAWDYNNLYYFKVDSNNSSIAEIELADRDKEEFYFNYNTFFDKAYDDTVLDMPIVSYDATKYNLSYTRKIYNSLETVTSEMTVSTNGGVASAVITFTSNLDGKIENFEYKVDNINEDPFVYLTFEDIGEYEFSMSILTKVNDTTYLDVTNSDPKLLGVQPTTKKMTIFGYQLKYADGMNGTAELRNAELSLYADVTQRNADLMGETLTANLGNGNPYNIDQLKLFAGNVVPSTNQAPLWFDYLGTLNTTTKSKYFYYANTLTMDFGKLSEYVPTEYGEYKKGQYFMNSGLYVVEINYKLSTLNFSNITFKQYFVFEIKNTAPSAQIINLGDNSILYNDAYTNQDVAINWDDSNPFNAQIVARYDLYDFNNNLINKDTLINKYGTESQTKLTKSGKYYVKLYYGRLGTSYSTWEFTIDKTPISGLKIIYDKLNGKDGVDAATISSINEPFTLKWDTKASGAEISIEHQQLLLVKDDSYQSNVIENLALIGVDRNGNKIYALKNGYKLSTISSSVKYQNITEFEVTQYALHLFRLYDQAGNELYYAVLLDNTSPTFMFEPKIDESNKFNIVNETTGIIWGNAKAITFNAPLEGESPLYDKFVENNLLPSICNLDKGIINIEFSSVTLHYADIQSNLYQTSIPTSYPAIQVVVDAKTKTISSYNSQLDTSSGALKFINDTSALNSIVGLDEFFYSVDVVDKGIKGISNTYGKSSTQLEVNLDASQVLAFSDDAGDIRLYNGSATNRDKIYITFYDEGEDFKVESLKLEFYPFAMDKSMASYPYLDTVAVEEDLLASSTYDPVSGKQKSQYFNLIFDTALNKEVTQAGKYVVTRVYEDLTGQQSLESRTKVYTFYVDRYNIVQDIVIDYPIDGDFSRTVGEYIKLVLGNNKQSAEFKDLLLSSANNSPILITDLLGINTVVPENKYSVLDDTGVSYTNVSSYNLNLTISYKPLNASDTEFVDVVNISANDINAVVNHLLNVSADDLMRAGIYKFSFTDNTGYVKFDGNNTINNVEPNTFSFRIQVNKELPQGTYYSKNDDGTDKEISHTISSSGSAVASSNDEELKFVFEETTDIYKAKIDYVDVLVERRAKGTSNWDNAENVVVRFEDAVYNEEGEVIYPSSESLTSLKDVKGIREPIKSDGTNSGVVTDEDDNVLDASGNIIYRYTIVLPTKNVSRSYYEGEYRITIHYYGDEKYYVDDLGTTSYYKNSISVVLDHTAPNFNLLRLVYADKYLPAVSTDPNVISKQDIIEYAKNLLETNPEKKERVRQFLRNYVFALPSDFVFYRATNNGFSMSQYDDYTYSDHDTNAIYVRKYNKFASNNPEDQQSYIESDPEYNDARQRFQTTDDNFKVISYGEYGKPKDPFYDTIAQETNYAEGYGQEGYYEIIEIDQAGNQRIYTVYLKRSAVDVVFSDGEYSEVGNASTPNLSLGYNYKISSINNLDCYTKINLYDSTGEKKLLKTFDINPDTNVDNLIYEINEYTKETESHKATGAKYEIEFLNRFGEDLIISLQRPGEELTCVIVDGTLNFNITLPTSTNSTWIEEFIVKQYNTLTGQLETLTHDLNGPIQKDDYSGVTYTFNAGEYYFYLIDNFGRGESQPIHHIFGINDVKELIYNNIELDGVTAGSVIFNYQTRLYNAEFYIDGVLVDNFDGYDNITTYYNEVTYVMQVNFGTIENDIKHYKIVLNYNTSGLDIDTEPYIYEFTIDTNLPNFELTDSNGNNMNYLLNNKDATTSKEIFISWNELNNDYGVVVTVKKDNGEPFVIEKGYSIYLDGTYTLTMTNKLNNVKSYTFSIAQSSAILYDVYANNQKLDIAIKNAQYNHLGISANVNVFVSIYDMTVVANEKKDLQAILEYEYNVDNLYNLKIYHILGSNSLYYSEYIALIKINENVLRLSNFLIGETPETMPLATGLSSTYYSKNVYASWQKSFSLDVLGFGTLTFEDFIKLDLYYNNTFVRRFDDNTINFTDSGEYRLYFVDIAGHKYNFVSGIITRDYYTIDLLNSVSFTINNGEPINNVIYNDKVTLTPTNTNRYDKGTFKITVTKNGEILKVSDYYSKGSYIFSEYGTYKVVMTAKINNIDLISEYTFTILSKNEANNLYSFNKYSQFEIIQITKEGVDITEQLKEKYNVNKLGEFNFSAENGEIGHYVVTVKVTQSQLKPEQQFTFEFWINSAEINFTPSIPFGTSTTKKITIEFNKYAIYQEFGNVVISISGYSPIVINSDTASKNELSKITLEKNQKYLIQVHTESGRLISSYMITKDEPLNTVAIIAIVISSLVVIAIVVLFIVFRTRMKVR